MTLQLRIIAGLSAAIREDYFLGSDVSWEDRVFLRTVAVRLEHGEFQAWEEVLDRLAKHPELATAAHSWLSNEGLIDWYPDRRRDLSPEFADLVWNEHETKVIAELAKVFDRLGTCKAGAPKARETPTKKAKTAIMYIEAKSGLSGSARIGRVQFSKTGRTIHYAGRAFQSLKGGYKCNYFDVETDDPYWISGCHKDGQDSLYRGIVEIDEDVREEYWHNIRERPDLVATTSFRSIGKYGRAGKRK